MVSAKRFLYSDTSDVLHTPISPTHFDLPNNFDPFLSPGTYAVYDNEYDCLLPGLYSWKVPQELNILRRIVPGDLYETISAMCWARVHGNTHDSKAITGVYSLSHLMRSQKIRVTCGYLILWMRHWLPSFGHADHRSVSVLTLEPYNNFDDGHIVLEVKIDNEWRMFDVANGVYFLHEGVHIDHVTFMDLLANDVQPDMHVLCPTTWNAEMYQGQVDYASYADMFWRFDDDRWAWYKRIFQSVNSIS